MRNSFAQHTQESTQKNFGKPVEWALVKDHDWSTPQLRKLDKPVSVLSECCMERTEYVEGLSVM